MTRRAQVYLAICFARHLGIGAGCVFTASRYSSPVYSAIKDVLPISVWGGLFLITAAACAVAAMTRLETPARIALLMSAVLSACWAWGFITAAYQGHTSVPTSPIAWVSLALYDLTMLRQPLRNPFESMTRRLLGDDRRAPDA